ncbi:MAG: hypothetical protein HY651_09580 [Acidobacteria bacterium]|nr:hypothetical protein [Acidobacteriota bacterium]
MKQMSGFVALLDVLGFTELVSGENHAEKMLQYVDSLGQITTSDEVETILFSDTIIMTVPGENLDSLFPLLRACSRSFGLLLSREIRVRGAISHGSFVRYRNPKGTFLAGRAIIDSYRFQQKQDWVGVMLAPSVVSKIGELESLCRSPRGLGREAVKALLEGCGAFVQRCANIPFHTPEPDGYEGWSVVPTKRDAASPGEMSQTLRELLRDLERLKSLAPDPNSQRKHRKAIEWLERVASDWESAGAYWSSS